MSWYYACMDSTNCKCGCGAQATPGKMFISGHNGRGRRKVPNTHTCEQCKKTFETRPHIKERKYCSSECRDQFRKDRTGANHPLYNRSEHPCKICGTIVLVTPSLLKSRRLCFCSPECAKESHRRAVSGVPKIMNRSGKNAARTRDGEKCVICGFSAVTAVHHIISKKDGGTNGLTNLVTLCPNHHYMAHAGLIDANVLREKATLFAFYKGNPVLTKKSKTGVNFKG